MAVFARSAATAGARGSAMTWESGTLSLRAGNRAPRVQGSRLRDGRGRNRNTLLNSSTRKSRHPSDDRCLSSRPRAAPEPARRLVPGRARGASNPPTAGSLLNRLRPRAQLRQCPRRRLGFPWEATEILAGGARRRNLAITSRDYPRASQIRRRSAENAGEKRASRERGRGRSTGKSAFTLPGREESTAMRSAR